jgi:hypothetical protein
MKKVIIWGYKSGHTHTFVHSSWYRAFKYLGYDTYWFDDNNRPDPSFSFENSLILTEGYADKYLPLCESSTYIVHVCVNPSKYLEKVKRLIDLRYNVFYQEHPVNYNYYFDKYRSEQLGPLVYYERDPLFDRVYMSWATDLLPHEINLEDAFKSRQNVSYFVGTVHSAESENQSTLEGWKKACTANGVQFVHIDPWMTPISDVKNKELVQQSFLAPDIRGPQNINFGYIACRTFKNISYGQIGLTNSLATHYAMEESTIYHNSTERLFELGKEYMTDYKRIQDQMILVRDKHTYVQRIQALEKIL